MQGKNTEGLVGKHTGRIPVKQAETSSGQPVKDLAEVPEHLIKILESLYLP